MPDGEYKYSKTDAETSLGYEPTRRAYRNFLASKDAKAVQALALAAGNIKYKDIGKTYTLISQTEMVLFWRFAAQNGHTIALNLLGACAEEALERRADAAHGKKRTEEERDERLAFRTQSKATRLSYTDILKAKLIEQYGEDEYKRMSSSYFTSVTISVNQHLFNQPNFKCDRDNMTPDQLVDIEHFEKQLARRANRYTNHTAEQLLNWMLENF
jgi:hypothetical protein